MIDTSETSIWVILEEDPASVEIIVTYGVNWAEFLVNSEQISFVVMRLFGSKCKQLVIIDFKNL